MSVDIALASIGIVSGFAALLLGVAQLTCEHAQSSWIPRLSTVLLSIASGWTAIDSWDSWAGVGPPVDGKAVAFVVVLAMSWAHRRIFRLTTANDRAPKRA